MGQIFSPKHPPTLSYQPADCPDAKATPPASYCPATNTIVVDLPALTAMAKVGGRAQHELPQGDDTALSIVTSPVSVSPVGSVRRTVGRSPRRCSISFRLIAAHAEAPLMKPVWKALTRSRADPCSLRSEEHTSELQSL